MKIFSNRDILRFFSQNKIPEAVRRCLKTVYELFLQSDWKINLCFRLEKDTSQDNISSASSDMPTYQTKSDISHCLHKWLVGLLGTLLLIKDDTKQLDGIEKCEVKHGFKRSDRLITNVNDTLNEIPLPKELTVLSEAECLLHYLWLFLQGKLSDGEEHWVNKFEMGEIAEIEELFFLETQRSIKTGNSSDG